MPAFAPVSARRRRPARSAPLTYVFWCPSSSCCRVADKRIVRIAASADPAGDRENEVRRKPSATTAALQAPAFVIGGAFFSGSAGLLYAMLFASCRWEGDRLGLPGNVLSPPDRRLCLALWAPIIGSLCSIWLSESMSVMWGALSAAPRVAFVSWCCSSARLSRSLVQDMAIPPDRADLTRAFRRAHRRERRQPLMSRGTRALESSGRTAPARPRSSTCLITTLRPVRPHPSCSTGPRITGTPANRIAHLGLARSFHPRNQCPSLLSLLGTSGRGLRLHSPGAVALAAHRPHIR